MLVGLNVLSADQFVLFDVSAHEVSVKVDSSHVLVTTVLSSSPLQGYPAIALCPGWRMSQT